MSYDISFRQQGIQGNDTPSNFSKGKLDLIVLQYMARRLHLTLCQLDSTSMTQPMLYTLRERHQRTHRIAIYRYQELSLERAFMFVGFVSRKQKHLSSVVNEDILAIDRKLITELISNPGILSYSSLELRNGDWCNLVVLNGEEAKTHLKNTSTHTYAAYQLAPRYYEWIRLHNGIMSEGLDHTEMLLQKTKYYTFHAAQQRPVIRERTYERHSANRSILSQSNYAFA